MSEYNITLRVGGGKDSVISSDGIMSVYIQNSGQILLDDMSMFAELYVTNFNTVTSLDPSYVDKYKLKSTCVSWNDAFGRMSKVTSFPEAFWNYSNMKYADSIFSECRSIVECPIDFTKTNATQMHDAFYNCHSLEQPPVLPKTVTNLYGCFSECINLKNVPEIPEGAKNCREMFFSCENITEAPVIPSSVNNIREMFNYCTNLRGTILVYTNTIANAYEFVGNEEYAKTIYCYEGSTTMESLKSAKKDWWNATILPFNVVTNIAALVDRSNDMWTSYTEIPVEYTPSAGIETSLVQDWSNTFKGAKSITALPRPMYNMKSSVNCESMFEECNTLGDASSIKFGNSTTSISKCFLNDRSLTNIPYIPNGVTNMDYAFAGCDSLSVLPELPESVVSMNYTFKNCMSHGVINYSIPNNVKYLVGTFDTDEWVTGDVYIHSDIVEDATDFMANHHDPTNIWVHADTKTYNSFYKAMGNSTYNSNWVANLKTF